MSKKGRLSGWHLTKDENWKERLAEIQSNRPGSTPPPPPEPPPHVETLKLSTYVCDPDCVICHGETFFIDHSESAIPCPNAHKVDGGD